MIDFSIVGVWASGAIIVVGVIQWLKGFVQQIVRSGVPTWVWSVIMPLCAIGTSRAFDLFGGQAAALKWVWNALGIWAASQLGIIIAITIRGLIMCWYNNLSSAVHRHVRCDIFDKFIP